MPDQKREDRIEVSCPLCRGTLTVDVATGVVLHAAAPSGPSTDFETALGEVKAAANQREEQFFKAFQSERQRRASLDKKFETAREKASQNPDEKPFNPMDMD